MNQTIRKALENSTDIVDDEARDFLLWFLVQSEGFTKSICTPLPFESEPAHSNTLAHSVQRSIHSINSSVVNTKLDTVLKKEGIKNFLYYGHGEWSTEGEKRTFTRASDTWTIFCSPEMTTNLNSKIIPYVK